MELIRYGLGEFERIPTYAKDRGFCAWPSDFPAWAEAVLRKEAHAGGQSAKSEDPPQTKTTAGELVASGLTT